MDLCEMLNMMKLAEQQYVVVSPLLSEGASCVDADGLFEKEKHAKRPNIKSTGRQRRHCHDRRSPSKTILHHFTPIHCTPFSTMFLQSDTASEYSTSSSQSTSVEFFGCAFLQAVQAQMDTFPDSGSQYLETVFTHREIFMSHPTAHPQCSRGFSDMAYILEQQAWKEERAADNVAVAAFRHEAWSIAASL